MRLLQNINIFLDSNFSFKLGLLNTILEALQILRIHLFSGGANKSFHKKLWLKFSFKCFKGVESLATSSHSSHCNYKNFPVSPMYVCSETHSSSYITYAECRFFLFSLNSPKFLMKCLLVKLKTGKCFMLNLNFCKKIGSCKMGGSLSVIFSNIYMAKKEREVVTLINTRFYKRFVYDIINKRKKDQPDSLIEN